MKALTNPDNRYKSREELLALFAQAGIDGTKPVIVYCNSGSLSSFYFYALQESCGFKNVRMYDGSWSEWSNLTAFEPGDPTYVKHDTDTVYPDAAPALLLSHGRNNHLEWDGKRFVDAVTGVPASSAQVKPGGSLGGNTRWDTAHRSEHIVFRASEKVNTPSRRQTYNSDIDRPEVDTDPDYAGDGGKILMEDRGYGK